jgi:hypothetical protein
MFGTGIAIQAAVMVGTIVVVRAAVMAVMAVGVPAAVMSAMTVIFLVGLIRAESFVSLKIRLIDVGRERQSHARSISFAIAYRSTDNNRSAGVNNQTGFSGSSRDRHLSPCLIGCG